MYTGESQTNGAYDVSILLTIQKKPRAKVVTCLVQINTVTAPEFESSFPDYQCKNRLFVYQINR